MKMLNMFCALALFALSNVALAYDYSEDVAPPSGLANFQEDVVVGEEMPAENIAPEAYEGDAGLSYGYAPSWSGGCCDDSYGHHSHLWDNYCAEKHCGWFGRRCCGKAFGGCGGFSKGCCEPKCGKCRKICLPKLHMPKICLPKLHLKDRCCQKAKCCKATICQKASGCRKLHLPKFQLFSRKGCCKSKCCKGVDEIGEVIFEGQPDVNEVPAPAMDMNEVPMPPMDPAA
jgi:hypothetical protein